MTWTLNFCGRKYHKKLEKLYLCVIICNNGWNYEQLNEIWDHLTGDDNNF